MAKHWYVLHVYSGYEKQVKNLLEERIELSNVQDMFGRILVPTESVSEIKDGKKRVSERKFFPGYVLVEMEYSEDAWHLVRNTPKVLGFIGGTPERPAPITEKEANAMLMRLETSSEQPKPKTMFEAGEVVRVIDGPFAEYNGAVEEVNYEKGRLQVSVLIFGRSTPVELQFSQVEKIK